MLMWKTLPVFHLLPRVYKPNVFYAPSMAVHIPLTHVSVEELALEHLRSGSVIAVPTDTVYGLACDATNSSAISKLYTIKGRNEKKPIAICLSDTVDLKSWAVIEHLPKNLVETLLPGPVTLILKSVNPSLDKSLSYQGKVGIRIPDYSFIRDLSRGLNRPLALTSANLSNNPSALEISEFSSIWDKITAIFDGGRLEYNKSASTILDLSEVGKFQIVREGAACQETIVILKNFNLKQIY